jgi:hypothetical protein
MSPEIEAIIKLDDQIDNLKRMRQRLLLTLLDSDITTAKPIANVEWKGEKKLKHTGKQRYVVMRPKVLDYLKSAGWSKKFEILENVDATLPTKQFQQLMAPLIQTGQVVKRGHKASMQYNVK